MTLFSRSGYASDAQSDCATFLVSTVRQSSYLSSPLQRHIVDFRILTPNQLHLCAKKGFGFVESSQSRHISDHMLREIWTHFVYKSQLPSRADITWKIQTAASSLASSPGKTSDTLVLFLSKSAAFFSSKIFAAVFI